MLPVGLRALEVIGVGSWERPLQVWQVNLGTTVDGRLQENSEK